MGVVYLAKDTQLGRKVALKIPRQSALAEPESLERFYREARTAATLRHSNICPVYDVGQINGVHYLTMAYIPGRPASSFATKGRLPPARQVALLIRKIALALDEAHRNGVVHRDLKPSNIMLDDRGEPIVMDFGLARNTNTAENARLTQSGAILGTPAFMAPEQVRGESEQIGPRSDIYALGVMLYQLLTGELPFSGPILTVFAQILRDTPKKPSEHRPDVAPVLEAICLKMMAREAAQRYSSMKEVAQALTDYLKSGSAPRQDAGQVNRAPTTIGVPGDDPGSMRAGSTAGLLTPKSTSHGASPPDLPAETLRSPNRRRALMAGSAAILALVAFATIVYSPFMETTRTPDGARAIEEFAPSGSSAPRAELPGTEAREPFLPIGAVFTGTSRFFQPGGTAPESSTNFTFTVNHRDQNRVEARAELLAFNTAWAYRGFCRDHGNGEGVILIEDVDAVDRDREEEGITTIVIQVRDQGNSLSGVGFFGLVCCEFSATLSEQGDPAPELTDLAPPITTAFSAGSRYAGDWIGYSAGSTESDTQQQFNLRFSHAGNGTAQARLHLADPEQDWDLRGEIIHRTGQLPILVVQDVDLIGSEHPLEGKTTLLIELSEDGSELRSRGFSTIGLRSESTAMRESGN